MLRVQKDLLIDEKELLKALADYETINTSLLDLFGAILITLQLVLYLGIGTDDAGYEIRVKYRKIQDIEKKLTDKKAKLEELFYTILIPAKEALLRSKLKEEIGQETISEEPRVVVHQHAVEDEAPEIESYCEDDENAIDFLSLP